MNPIMFAVVAAAFAVVLRVPSTFAAEVELDAADRVRYQEAVDLIQTWPGYGDQLQRAYQILADIGKRNPRSAHALAGFAEIKYRLYGAKQGTAGDVVQLAHRATRLDPDNADAQVVYAKVMLDEGNEIEALRRAKRAVELAPEKPEAMYVMANSARRAKRYDEAEAWFRKSVDRLENKQRKANVMLQLATMLSEREPLDADKTAAAFVRATELSGDSIVVLNEAAVFLKNHTERYDEAIAMLRKALRISDYEIGRMNLGLTLFYKWGHATLHPEKYRGAGQTVLGPEEITRETGLSKESAFAHNASVDGPPYALLAMLKLGMIKDVDAFPQNCECPNNAMLSAAQNNRPDIIRTLIEHGANVNVVDHKYGATPLQYAVRAQNPELVAYLIRSGARVNVQDKHGHLIVEYAIADAKPGDTRVLQQLLENGGDTQGVSRHFSSLLAVAVYKSNPAAVALLLDRYHADPNARMAGPQSEPVLSLAARAGHADAVKVVELLLKAGANPWIKAGGGDLVRSLESSKEAYRPMPGQLPDPATRRIVEATDATISMLNEARKKTPKPAGF